MSVKDHARECAKSKALDCTPPGHVVACTCGAVAQDGFVASVEVLTHAEADELGPGFWWVLTGSGEEVVEIVNDEADEPMIYDTIREGWVRVCDIPDGMIRGWAGPIPSPCWDRKFPDLNSSEDLNS